MSLFPGAPRRIRTFDLQIRSLLLYPAELWALVKLNCYNGAGDGNRTHAASLEGWSSTTELHPHIIWSGRRDSNPRLSPWQGDALPLSHSRSFVNCGAGEEIRTPTPCGTRS